jgi:hypothetical protein
MCAQDPSNRGNAGNSAKEQPMDAMQPPVWFAYAVMCFGLLLVVGTVGVLVLSAAMKCRKEH